MPLDISILCQYRLERAKEDLLTAESNHKGGFYKASINRSYYTIFHCIRAVNIFDGFDASKHSSVIAHFNQYFVHTGEFDKKIYKIIDSAYRIREKCDYSDFFLASKEDSQIQLNRARELYEAVTVYVKKRLKEESKKTEEMKEPKALEELKESTEETHEEVKLQKGELQEIEAGNEASIEKVEETAEINTAQKEQ